MAAAQANVGGGAGTETRRNFLSIFGWGMMAIIGLQAAVAFIVFFWPRKLGTFGSQLPVGAATEYQVGDVKYFVDGKFYLVRLEEGFMALFQKCVHLGCTVPWRPEFEFTVEGQTSRGWFRCPCHGSTYNKTGQIVFGPAPRPLDYMRISGDASRMVVDTGSIRKREQYDPSQAFRV